MTAPAATVQPGGVVLLGVGAGPLRLGAPCRVVYVVDEPRRKGFAYGMLCGHPESGEESFIIEQNEDGITTFTITAFSTPATTSARAAGPTGRAIQGLVTRRYLRAPLDDQTSVAGEAWMPGFVPPPQGQQSHDHEG